MLSTGQETAIVTWIRGATGLDAEHVFMAQQKRPIPAGRYVSIRVTNSRIVGQDWLQTLDNPDPDEGEEILHRARGTRELTLSLQCFAGPLGNGLGDTGPAGTLEAVRAARRLPSVDAALDAVGIGVLGYGPIQSIDGIIGSTGFEPRAILEIRLHVTRESQETGTYIEDVELRNQLLEEYV